MLWSRWWWLMIATRITTWQSSRQRTRPDCYLSCDTHCQQTANVAPHQLLWVFERFSSLINGLTLYCYSIVSRNKSVQLHFMIQNLWKISVFPWVQAVPTQSLVGNIARQLSRNTIRVHTSLQQVLLAIMDIFCLILPADMVLQKMCMGIVMWDIKYGTYRECYVLHWL